MKSEKTSIEVGPVAAQDTQMRGDSMNEGTVGMVDILDTDAPFYRKLLKTIDWHLLPLMTAAYMIQFLDKQTLAQASIMGIVEDLVSNTKPNIPMYQIQDCPDSFPSIPYSRTLSATNSPGLARSSTLVSSWRPIRHLC
jgi:hypothetical protein